MGPFTRFVAAGAIILGLTTGSALAEDTYWQHDPATPGDWFDPDNWTNGLPGAGYVDNGGTAVYGAGDSYISSIHAGYNGRGTVVQDGGSIHLHHIWLGHWAPTGTGTYILNDGSIRLEDGITLGSAGSGCFAQNGGRVYGRWPNYRVSINGGGVYRLGGTGQLTAGFLHVMGDAARSGRFVQNGGQVDVSTQICIGRRAPTGAAPCYEMNGGDLTPEAVWIGYDSLGGRGIMKQDGGIHAPGTLAVSERGTYEFTGGMLEVQKLLRLEGTLDFRGQNPAVRLADQAWADFTRGTPTVLNAGDASFVGGANSLVLHTAAFDPATAFHNYLNDGVTHQLGTDLAIPAGKHIRFPVHYTLDDHVQVYGQLDYATDVRPNLYGGVEVFDGGWLRAHLIHVDDSRSGMSGGLIDWSFALMVGYQHTGVFTQTGGTVSMAAIEIGCGAGSDGHYKLIGPGTIEIDEIVVGKMGAGRFTQSSGTVNVRSGGRIVLGAGRGADGLYEMSGGALNAGYLRVGQYQAMGRFVQTGGTVTGRTHIGCSGPGTYELSGGLLQAKYITIGDSYEIGTGEFIHTGGTSIVTQRVRLLSGGYYELSGMGELTAGDVEVGYRADTEFRQTGGTCHVTNELLLGYYIGLGVYNFSGGTLTTGRTYVAAGTLRVTGALGMLDFTTYEQETEGELISEITAEGISRIDVDGLATLGGTWTVLDSGAPYGVFDVLTAGGGISSGFDTVVLPEGDWAWGIDGGATLWVEHVPEPATLSLMALGGLTVIRRRRR